MTTAEMLDVDRAERVVQNGTMIRVALLRDREGLSEAFQGYQEFKSGFKGHLRSELRRNA